MIKEVKHSLKTVLLKTGSPKTACLGLLSADLLLQSLPLLVSHSNFTSLAVSIFLCLNFLKAKVLKNESLWNKITLNVLSGLLTVLHISNTACYTSTNKRIPTVTSELCGCIKPVGIFTVFFTAELLRVL